MSICKIALEDIYKIDFLVTKGMTGREVYKKYAPDYMINGALYDMSSHQNIVRLMDEKQPSGYLFANQGIGINGLKHLLWADYETAQKDTDIRDFIAGAPVLVKVGGVRLDWGNKYSAYVDGCHKRSCIGFSQEHFFMVASDYNNTINGLADYCVQQGMKYAINLDGGGSCHLQQGSKALKASGRANASWVLVYLKKQESEDDNMEKVKVKCNNHEQEGFIKDGVTYVPIRFVGENLGANVAWDGTTKTVTVTKE